MIIDTHTFIGKSVIHNITGEYLDFKVEELRKVQKKVREEVKEDIMFLVIPIHPEGNKGISQVVRDNPDLILGAYAHAVLTPNPFTKVITMEEIENLVLQNEIIGLKIVTTPFGMAIDDERIYPFAKLAGDISIPFLVHCSYDQNDKCTSFERKQNLAKMVPKTKIIYAHLGGGGFIKQSIEDNIRLAEEFDNVYFNTTGLSGEIKILDYDGKEAHIIEHGFNPRIISTAQEILRYMYSRIPDRIIFGSDAPYLEHSLHPLNLIGSDAKAKIGYENPKKIFERLLRTI